MGAMTWIRDKGRAILSSNLFKPFEPNFKYTGKPPSLSEKELKPHKDLIDKLAKENTEGI